MGFICSTGVLNCLICDGTLQSPRPSCNKGKSIRKEGLASYALHKTLCRDGTVCGDVTAVAVAARCAARSDSDCSRVVRQIETASHHESHTEANDNRNEDGVLVEHHKKH
eukprot:m.32559 g.32559  ORF g.32559 m.32559 type:complete len:110 (-) comp12445_c0_seq2:954-1283(-)